MERPVPAPEIRLSPGDLPSPPRIQASRPLLHLLLFLATVVTTMVAGSLLHSESSDLSWEGIREVLGSPAHWRLGIPYSLSVLSILLSHELGHYLACRHYGIPATLPYFLPGIPILGTFGAFIRIRGRITSRRALFDIGIAGPLSGFVVAIPILLYGMSQSELITAPTVEPDFYLGFPALFSLTVPLFFPEVPEGAMFSSNPYLYAAWVGMLATSLNLLPAGQLDGGHICYAVSRRFHSTMSRLTLIGVILMGALHQAWLLWAVILLFLGDRHPPLLDEQEPMTPARFLLAVLALIILLLSFMPVPIHTPG